MSPRLAIMATLALLPSLLAAQARTGALAGTVRDTIGNPLRMVAVMVETTELSAVTDDSGRFHIKGIPAGRNEFTVRRIGFAAVEFGTMLAADSTLVIDIRMKPLTTLGAVNVTATGSVRLHRTGFFERKEVGLGSFVTPEKVDSLSNLPSGSLMLLVASVRGVRRSGCVGNQCDVILRSAPCRWLFIDGHQVEGGFDEMVSPSQIYAIEVYDRSSIVPAEFQGRLPPTRAGRGNVLRAGGVGCGAIAVWTKGRAAP